MWPLAVVDEGTRRVGRPMSMRLLDPDVFDERDMHVPMPVGARRLTPLGAMAPAIEGMCLGKRRRRPPASATHPALPRTASTSPDNLRRREAPGLGGGPHVRGRPQPGRGRGAHLGERRGADVGRGAQRPFVALRAPRPLLRVVPVLRGELLHPVDAAAAPAEGEGAGEPQRP